MHTRAGRHVGSFSGTCERISEGWVAGKTAPLKAGASVVAVVVFICGTGVALIRANSGHHATANAMHGPSPSMATDRTGGATIRDVAVAPSATSAVPATSSTANWLQQAASAAVATGQAVIQKARPVNSPPHLPILGFNNLLSYPNMFGPPDVASGVAYMGPGLVLRFPFGWADVQPHCWPSDNPGVCQV